MSDAATGERGPERRVGRLGAALSCSLRSAREHTPSPPGIMGGAEPGGRGPERRAGRFAEWLLSGWRPWLLVVLLGLVLYLPGLGTSGLWDPWEPHYAEVAREMVESGNWLEPTWEHSPGQSTRRRYFFSKPVLIMWLMALPMKLFGVHHPAGGIAAGAEWYIRFPFVLCALLGLLGVFWMGRHFFGVRVGLLGAVILATCPQYYFIARQAMTDMPLVGLMTAGVALLLVGGFGERPRPGLIYGGYLLLGLATLAKGLTGLALPGLVFLVYLLISGQWQLLRRLRVVSGGLLALCVAAPWYVYISVASAARRLLDDEGKTFFQRFFLHDHLFRLAQGVHGDRGTFDYFLRELGLGCHPWSVFMGWSLFSFTGRLQRQPTQPRQQVELLLWIWVVAGYALFSLSMTKFHHYALPVVPAAAVLIVLAAVGGDNQLHVFTADGKIKSGFPVDLQGYTSMPPSIADMDGDGAMDIVIMNRYGLLQVLDSGGRLLLEKDFNEAVYGNISLADVDADSVPEIIFGTMRKKIHVFKMDSTEMDSFPKTFSTLIDRGIALVDVDADERPELLFGTFDRKLHLLQYDGKEMEGWPLELSSRIIHTPIISQINSANVFVVTTLDKKLLILNEKAQIIAQATLAERVSAAPAFADMDKDGVPEIVFSTSDAVLHLLATDGREVSPFPLHLPEVVNSSPVVYDLKGDGSPDIILTSEAGRVLVFDKQGQSLENFPAQLNGNLNASPVISDLDGDGDVEIISGGAEGLFVLDLSASYAESNLWQSWLGNNQRTGFYAQPVTGIATDEPNIIVSRAGLKQNYPNPFGRGADLRGNPRTAISFQLSAAGFTELVVYNILGQKIKTLFAGATAKGRHRFMWDGRNDLQQEVGSGIYFYRLKGKDFTISRRMLLLR